MKKTITNPDGSTEVVEGTAEEIAEYERKRKLESATPAPTKKRRVLNEETVRAIAREEAAKVAPIIIQHHGICTCPVCCPWKPYWVAPTLPLPYVGDPLPGTEPYIITVTSTSDKVEIPNGNVPNSSGQITIGQQLEKLGATFLVQN